MIWIILIISIILFAIGFFIYSLCKVAQNADNDLEKIHRDFIKKQLEGKMDDKPKK